MDQFLGPETDVKHQFLVDHPETDIMDQFLDPETDIMGERTYIQFFNNFERNLVKFLESFTIFKKLDISFDNPPTCTRIFYRYLMVKMI